LIISRGVFKEKEMGTLVFVCPATGRKVSTGIEMETATPVRSRHEEVRCPHCKTPHRMSDIGAWIAEDEVSVVLPVMTGMAAFR
jgi:hypothetical protein